MKGYRPALDGVRAIAVLGVVAYHLGLPLPGGFLGVDVFFVLSGYLITGLLLSEHGSTGRVSLRRFWARRARRLLPALLIVVVVCALETRQHEPLLSFEARRGDMLATLGYVANWHFIATDQSYFASYVGASPLRHMWSLAIEEQFYLAWPLLVLALIVVSRRHSWIFPACVGVGAAASGVAMAAAYDVVNPSRAYLGTDARSHQLLLGALTAVALNSGGLQHTLARNIRTLRWAALILMALIGLAMCVLPDTSPAYYRGGSVMFAAAVASWLVCIEADPDGEVAHLLSKRPFVQIGRISYGIYLWHWPLILWFGAHDGGLVVRLWCLTATLAAAAISYIAIEAPIRRGQMPWLRTSYKRLAIAGPLAILAVAGLAVTATADDGIALARQLHDQSVSPCPPSQQGVCVRRPRDPGGILVATIGDSTALALDPGLRQEAARRGFGYVQAGRNGCTFLPLPMQADDAGMTAVANACARGSLELVNQVAKVTRPDVWIISDRLLRFWLHVDGKRYSIGSARHDAAVASSLSTMLRELTAPGAKVLLLEALPDGESLDCALAHRHRKCALPSTATTDVGTRRLNEIYRSAAAKFSGSVVFVSVADLVCIAPGHQCGPVIAGVVTRYDGVHYTARFSRRIVPLLLDRARADGISLPSSNRTGR